MGRLKSGYQIADHHVGFCRLCWKYTEERMASRVISRLVSGKIDYVPEFKPIERPAATVKTYTNAQRFLEELIAESKKPGTSSIEELLCIYASGHDYRLLQEKGLESSEVMEMLLDKIEQELIEREWSLQVWPWDEIEKIMDDPKWHQILTSKFLRRFSAKPFKPRLYDFKSAPKSSSKIFCPDHNPRRSIESRRRYQNNRKRITDFETEIDRLYGHYRSLCIGIHSDNDRQILRREAYFNVFSSTLEKIKELQADGKKQKEIADILKVSKQVVSNALKREKK